jgi:hypothetical protein
MTSNEAAGKPSVPEAGNRWSRRRALTVTAAAITVTLVGVGVVQSAHADPVPTPSDTALQPSGDVGRVQEHQNRLSELNTWIISQPDVHANGYVASVNDPEAGSTILLWHGAANQTQKAIADKAAQLGITATIQPRKYGLADLTRAQKALEGRSGNGAFANFTINSTAGITADFDGIVVYGEYIHPPTQGRTEADAALAKAAALEIGIAVSIEPGGVITPY